MGTRAKGTRLQPRTALREPLHGFVTEIVDVCDPKGPQPP
jgi:hypothetical protein